MSELNDFPIKNMKTTLLIMTGALVLASCQQQQQQQVVDQPLMVLPAKSVK